jgi:hypothetical protein
VFGPFGTIRETYKEGGRNTGYVRFADPYHAQNAAVSLNNQLMFGRQIRCKIMKDVEDALAKLPQQPMVSLTQLQNLNYSISANKDLSGHCILFCSCRWSPN